MWTAYSDFFPKSTVYKQGKQRNFAGEKSDQCDLSRVIKMNTISDGQVSRRSAWYDVQFPVYSASSKNPSLTMRKKSDKHQLKDSLYISDQYL